MQQRATELKEQAKQQLERDKQVKKEQEQKRLAEAQAQRAKEASWQQQREKNAETFQKGGRKLVQETKERQKRMDKNESSQDKLEREEGTKDRLAVLKAYKEEQEAIRKANRDKVQAVKISTDPSLIAASKDWASKQRAGSAEDKRKQVLRLQSQRRRVKEGHLEKCREIKGKVLNGKEHAKAVKSTLQERKKENAAGERANDYLVELEKLRVLAQKKKEKEGVYKKRYASTKAAAKWEESPALAKPNLSSLDPSVSGGLMG